MSSSKKRYLNVKAEAWLKDKFLGAKGRKSREYCGGGEDCLRCYRTAKFVCICSASLFQLLAPWMLCVIEVTAVLIIYLLCTSRSPLVNHELPRHFSYMHSLEDVVGLSCTRSALLSISYALGMKHMHWPYLYCSYLLAAACFPYIIVKMILFRYSTDAVPAAAVFTITGLFCWLHVFAARRTVEWARRRYQMGLAGFGYPWEEGEEAWGMLRSAPTVLEAMTKSGDGADLSPESLADEDSRFMDVAGIKVHYKEVVPRDCPPGVHDNCAIVLIHGFGGGVFAFRHIMEPLAQQSQCRVVRSSLGLTSRPIVHSQHRHSGERGNPYSMAAQAHLLLQFCAQLGLEHVIFAGHADGCLIALRAASIAASVPRTPTSAAPLHPVLSLRNELRFPITHHHSNYPAGQGSGESTPRLYHHLPGEAAASGPVGSLAATAGTGVSLAAELAAVAGADGERGISSQAPSESGRSSSAESSHAACVVAVVGPGAGAQLPGVPSQGAISSSGKTLIFPLTASSAVDGSGGADAATTSDSNDTGSSCSSGLVSVGDGARHRRTQSMPGPIHQGRVLSYLAQGGAATSAAGPGPGSLALIRSESEAAGAWPHVVGIALMHPNLSGQVGPALSRLLARSKLGRSILRPLLRSEVGEIANRRAWHNTHKLTNEVLELYKAPLRVEGWCESLIETTRLRKEQSDLGAYFRDARSLPALVLTGEHDRLVPPVRTEQLCAELPNSRLVIVHDCGHLSHEEAPGTLLQHLIPFCAAVADGAAALKGMHNRGSMGGLAAGQAEQGIVYAGSPDIV